MRSIRKRRLEKKTDYKLRLALLKSEKPRLVIRKSNKYLTAQIVTSEIAQDSVLCTVRTSSLISLGWPKEKSGSLKSLAACYIAGFLLGNKAKSLKINEALLDFGMHRNIHKSRIYSILKGALDSGLNVPHEEEILPDMESLNKDPEVSKIIKKLTGDKNG